jgi:arylsulfatase A-like enzyme
MRTRIQGLAALALMSVPLFQPVMAGEEGLSAPRPRSVLFYLMDTSRRDRMGFDGYERETTPFLAWLAERSVVFETCYAQAPWTKPSMASMLSSQYPSTTGVYKMEQRLDDDVLTWPEVLQASGTYTAGFSANIVMGKTLSNFAQGFDHFIESTLINRADPIRFASGSARLLNEHTFPWLDSTDHWPMLLYLHSVDPHEEYEPEPSYLKQFADPDRHEQFRGEWKQLLKSRPPIPGLYVTQDNFDRTEIDSASFIEHSSNLYDADILANDEQIRQLWDKLQQDGWGEDFIFVFTSDHGEEFFDHGGTCHGYSLYDEMIRVPLMIYAPGLLPAGKTIDTPVRSLDIYPTLCDLLGLQIPNGLQGESLVPLIHGQQPADERAIFAEHREDPLVRLMGQGSGVMVSLRRGHWKFILNQKSSQLIEKPRFELFDLDKDPGEQFNLAERHPDVVKRFEREVVEFISDHRREADLTDWVSLDPEVLAQLRSLGYIGEEQAVTDLWPALGTGEPEAVRRRLAAGADVDQPDGTFGVHPIGMVAMTGNLEIAKLLIASGAEVDARNQDGSTALHGAAFLGRVELLELLLEHGADPDAKNIRGETVLGGTAVPWDITEFLAAMLQIPLDREEIEAGRLRCAEVLRAIGSKSDP